MGWTLGGLELALNAGVGGTEGGLELMASGGAILRLRQRTAACVEVFLSRGGRRRVLTLCRNWGGGACGGVFSRCGRRRVVRLCVVKRSRRPIGTLCRHISRWKFPLYGAKRSQRCAGDRKPRRMRDRSAFAKSSEVWQKC